MRIPSPSDVLIVGANPFSLAFATILGNGGLNVLVVDESLELKISTKELSLSTDILALLKNQGYKFSAAITANEVLTQSLSLLAQNLCCVVWNTSFYGGGAGKYTLMNDGKGQPHQSSYAFKEADLSISESDEASFRNILALAWRLIGVVNHKLRPNIVHSFEKERQQIVDFFTPIEKKSFFKRLFTPPKQALTLSESAINLHLSQQEDIKAGELLPNYPYYNEQEKREATLSECCHYEQFSILIFGTLNPHFLFNVAKWLQFNFSIKLFYFPFTEKNESLFKNLNIAQSEQRTIVVRPDGFISLVNDTVDCDIIDNYLRNVLLMLPLAENE